MATTIQFRVPAVPVAQPRQRHRIITTGGKAFASNYTPKNSPVNAYKSTVQLAAQEAYSGPPLDGPLWMAVQFVFPRPKSMCWKTKPTPRAPHTGKPDADNLLKSLTDSLNGLTIADDARLHRVSIEKWIAAGDEQPHCLVTITQLNGGSDADLPDRPIWDRIAELAESLPEEAIEQLPTDGASEHDHYLYGAPKRKVSDG